MAEAAGRASWLVSSAADLLDRELVPVSLAPAGPDEKGLGEIQVDEFVGNEDGEDEGAVADDVVDGELADACWEPCRIITNGRGSRKKL